MWLISVELEQIVVMFLEVGARRYPRGTSDEYLITRALIGAFQRLLADVP